MWRFGTVVLALLVTVAACAGTREPVDGVDTPAADAVGTPDVPATDVPGEGVSPQDVPAPQDVPVPLDVPVPEDVTPDDVPVAQDIPLDTGDVVPVCPDNPPGPGAPCADGLECTYGEECCCGECHVALYATCEGGQFQLLNSDACLGGGWCGQFPCCTQDADCDQGTDAAYTCAFGELGSDVGRCLLLPDAGACWDDGDCAADERCIGAAFCPCDLGCGMADMPGVCQEEGELGDIGDPCGQSGGECKPELVCCYPCGIPDCQWQCAAPCDSSEEWCDGGCPLVP